MARTGKVTDDTAALAEKRRKQTKYLSADPAAEDEFDSRSHDRVGLALAQEIEELLPQGGAIGLEGRWGSGKSTVLSIAEKQVENSTIGPFFVFDAWAHQSDPFKGAFLDRWIQWLTELKPKHAEYLDRTKKELRGKITNKEVRTSPHLTLTGFLLAIVALFLPLAILWLSPLAFSSAITTSVPPGLHWIAMALIVLPLVIVGISAVYQVLYKKSEVKWLQAVAVLAQKHRTDTNTTEIENSDPTTNVFSDLFWAVWERVKSEGDRFVVVIENIDRLPPARVADVWADVHTIASLNRGTESDRRFVVVVPYDPAHIQEALLEHKNDSSRPDARELFTKVFVRRLQVSEPIATEWSAFFKAKLCQAFGQDVVDADGYHLRRLLEENLRETNRKPTPRHVITYINDLVLTYRERGDEIPLPVIGAYVLNREQIAGNSAQLASGEIPTSSERTVLENAVDDAWQRELAALHYAVAPNVAMQLLLDDRIENALRRGEADELSRLSGATGFSSALRRMVQNKSRSWATESVAILDNVAAGLTAVECDEAEKVSAARALSQAYSDLKADEKVSPGKLKGIFGLLSLLNPAARLQAANSLQGWAWRSAATASDLETGSVAIGERWAEFTDSIVQALDEGQRHAYVAGLKLPQGAASVCGAAACFAFSQTPEYRRIPCSFARTGGFIDAAVVQLISESSDILEYAIEGLREWQVPTGTPVTDAIVQQLRAQENANDEGAREMYLRCLERVTAAKDKPNGQLATALKDGTFLIIWAKCNDANLETDDASQEAFAIATMILLATYKGGSLPGAQDTSLGNSASAIQKFDAFRQSKIDNENVLRRLVALVRDHELFGGMLEAIASSGSSAGLPAQIVRELVASKELGALNLTRVVSSYSKLDGVIGDGTLSELTQLLVGCKPDFEKHFEKDVSWVPDAFFAAINRVQLADQYRTLFQAVEKHVREIDANGWYKALTEEDGHLRLLFKVIGRNGFYLSASVLRDPLLEHADAIVSGGQAPPKKFGGEWPKLPNALSDEFRKSFYDDLFNVLSKSTGTYEDIATFLMLYRGLLSEGRLDTDPSVVAGKIISPLLASEDEAKWQLIKDHAAALKTAISQGGKGEKQLVREAIEGCHLPDDEKKEIAKLLGVRYSGSRKVQKADTES